MCGIFGIASVAGNSIPLSDAQVCRLRDIMSHRGPDGSGLWRRGNVVLAHRRLAVVDLSSAASQPMTTPDSRYAITYNGELYNDAELRAELSSLGVRFHTRSDTETVLHAIAIWGTDALARMRGMFALAWVDHAQNRMILARDPLGIKPLFYWLDGEAAEGSARQIVFASELPPILSHPDVSVRPSLPGISAYLTTIRTTFGGNTLFENISTVRPGQALVLDLSGTRDASHSDQPKVSITVKRLEYWRQSAETRVRWRGNTDCDDRHRIVRATIQESVRLHMRSDVPACVLLSGGLDSSIIASCASQWNGRPARSSSSSGPSNTSEGRLRSYCSGASDQPDHGDFAYARLAAAHLGTRHAEAPVTRAVFRERWPDMIHALGVPLSTPNEVAIHHVARALRRDGQVVALSGEGADELFAGYEQPMRQALAFETARRSGAASYNGVETQTTGAGGLHQLHANAWVPLHLKQVLLNDTAWHAIENDNALQAFYVSAFAACERDCVEQASQSDPDESNEGDSLQPHLHLLREINLAGLLARLDTATMLASVEGRTPFADSVVASLAESLPMQEKFRTDSESETGCGNSENGSVATMNRVTHMTKRSLRAAFEADLPAEIVARPKASFPLPFEQWVADHASQVRESSLARELFSPAAIELVEADPCANWRLAWPMLNLAMWGERWWG